MVGVLAEAFFFPSPEEEIWTPYVDPGWSISSEPGPDGQPSFSFRMSFITALGRLGPGVSLEQATTEVRTILQRRGFTASVTAAETGRVMGGPPDLPLAAGRAMTTSSVLVAGRPEPVDPRRRLMVPIGWVSPGYFDTIRVRLLEGRLFTGLDRAGSPGVVVVSETLARHLSGDGEAVGQRVRFGFENVDDGGDQWREVIGVVADLQYAGLAVGEQRAEAFLPVHQTAAARSTGAMFITVRTAGDPIALIPFLEEAVVEAHPRATIEDVITMDGRLSLAVAQPRFYALLVGFFSVLALVLAASGIYSLLSYTVAQRQGEIGIRMALGARRGDILGLVVRQGAILVAVGAVVGLAAAAASSRVLQSFLYGVSTGDLTPLIRPADAARNQRTTVKSAAHSCGPQCTTSRAWSPSPGTRVAPSGRKDPAVRE